MTNGRRLGAIAAVLTWTLGGTLAWGQRTAATVTSPADHLGYPVGTDFKLPDWNEVSSYYRKLAEQSPNVRLSVEGKTTLGRDFLLAVISSEENLGKLEDLKGHARVVADPRGASPERREAALRDGKVFIVVTPAMHSNEVAGTQFGMEFAYNLATSNQEPWRSARDKAVILLTPNLNPDGLDEVVHWYRRTVGKSYEGEQPLKLYQHYTGHDNNRDWFMLTQAETRILSRLIYREWRPQICWDVHQQGGSSERMFIPPYRDPLNPNIDPAVAAATSAIGTRAAMDMTRDGLRGVASATTYDSWWHGGNRGVPARHNMIGILTEAASANMASPVFVKAGTLRPVHGKEHGPSVNYVMPWNGGWWRVRDIIDYEMAFARSLLATVCREPRTWLATTMDANARAVERGRSEGVRGWIIPAAGQRDPSAVRRLLDALIDTGIEVHVTDADVTTSGRTHPAGSIVIRRDQPWGAHVKDLFEVQRYPKGSEPYDVAGWTLPLLMGVHRVEVLEPMDQWKLTPAKTSADAIKGVTGDPRLSKGREGTLASSDTDAWTEVARRLADRKSVRLATSGPGAGLLVTTEGPGTAPASDLVARRMPRVGIYTPWSGNADEGWLRWVFDTWKIPYLTVRNEELRAGRLAELLDVLIVPSTSAATLQDGRASGTVPEEHAGGLQPEGSAAVHDFVRGGGTLITLASASKWAIDLFALPLTDVTAGSSPTTQPATAEGSKFACPGSVLRGLPVDHPLTAGLPDSLPLFFASGIAWKEGKSGEKVPVDTLLRYAPTQLLLSGYISRPETIAGHAAWVRATVDRGRVHLFGFQPHYRSWSQANFQLLFRAMIFDSPAAARP